MYRNKKYWPFNLAVYKVGGRPVKFLSFKPWNIILFIYLSTKNIVLSSLNIYVRYKYSYLFYVVKLLNLNIFFYKKVKIIAE